MILNWDKAVRMFCVAGIMVWATLLINKFYNFGYYDYDLAIYAQAMWRMVHGSLDVSLFGMNFLGNHAEYISFLVAPIYFFFPHPLTLVVLNVAAFFISAYILFRIAKSRMPAWAAAFVFILYVFYPANIFMLIFEFHFESLALPLIMGMLWAFLERRLKPFLVLGLLTCLVKENMPLVVIMFGLVSLFRRDVNKWLWGGLPIIFGAAYFYVVMFHLIPLARSGLPSTGNIYWGLFRHIAPTPEGIMARLISDPGFLYQQLFTWDNFHYFKSLFAPVGCVPFLASGVLVLAAPFFFQNIFSAAWQQHTVYFHYAASLAPFIFCSLALALASLFQRISMKVCVFVLAGLVALTLLCDFLYSGKIISRLGIYADRMTLVQEEMVQMIPKDAGVIADFSSLSHLTSRTDLYASYDLWRGTKSLAGYPFKVPGRVGYALIDLEDPWLRGDMRSGDAEEISARLKDAFLNGEWHVLRSFHRRYLLERRSDGRGIRQWP